MSDQKYGTYVRQVYIDRSPQKPYKLSNSNYVQWGDCFQCDLLIGLGYVSNFTASFEMKGRITPEKVEEAFEVFYSDYLDWALDNLINIEEYSEGVMIIYQQNDIDHICPPLKSSKRLSPKA
jgi:hypothetical protein